MLNIESAESVPSVRRGGARPSEERIQIQNALASGSAQMIKDIEFGSKYNALQQRIRQAAHSMNLKVNIVFSRHEDNHEIGDVYFVGVSNSESNSKKDSVRRAVKNDVKTEV
jgi:3-dehydroquinate dehydratase